MSNSVFSSKFEYSISYDFISSYYEAYSDVHSIQTEAVLLSMIFGSHLGCATRMAIFIAKNFGGDIYGYESCNT